MSAHKALILDDLERFPLGESLFHLYNTALEMNCSLLLLAQRAPKDWDFQLADSRSRLLSRPSVAVGQPDDMVLMAVLIKLFSDRQLHVPFEVVQYILSRIERSFSALRSLVRHIDATSLEQKRNITIPFVKTVLENQEDE